MAAQDVVIIGGGPAGLAAVRGYRDAGGQGTLTLVGAEEVTIVAQEPVPQAARLGREAGERLASWMREAGVELVLDAEVEGIEDGRRVQVAGGLEIDADVVLLATGVAPNGELAGALGPELHDGAVTVDASLRSANPFLSAAGDVAWAQNACAGRHLRAEHWGDALAQGEVAGRALACGRAQWEEVPGFWSTIGSRTLKYAAWGDGFEEARLIEHEDGAFTTRYLQDGVAVGVLTHRRDEDYERGRGLIAEGRL